MTDHVSRLSAPLTIVIFLLMFLVSLIKSPSLHAFIGKATFRLTMTWHWQLQMHVTVKCICNEHHENLQEWAHHQDDLDDGKVYSARIRKQSRYRYWIALWIGERREQKNKRLENWERKRRTGQRCEMKKKKRVMAEPELKLRAKEWGDLKISFNLTYALRACIQRATTRSDKTLRVESAAELRLLHSR